MDANSKIESDEELDALIAKGQAEASLPPSVATQPPLPAFYPIKKRPSSPQTEPNGKRARKEEPPKDAPAFTAVAPVNGATADFANWKL
jgi:hypothetical protein